MTSIGSIKHLYPFDALYLTRNSRTFLPLKLQFFE
jgi:hypothetical protein